MSGPDRDRIGRAFARARDYDRHAAVQRKVAGRLAAQIGSLALPPAPRVWEIGCGTGFLTEALLAQRPGAPGGEWLISDLCPAMVARCRARVGARDGLRFAALDGERDTPAGQFDLICSSLAVQWFADLPAAIPRLVAALAPGGHLLFTTLAAGTFAEWGAAHAAEGLREGTPNFASVAALQAMHVDLQMTPPVVTQHRETHASARDFLRALKAIGAGTASPGHQPLTPAQLRRVMRRFDAEFGSVTYEVVTCHFGAGHFGGD